LFALLIMTAINEPKKEIILHRFWIYFNPIYCWHWHFIIDNVYLDWKINFTHTKPSRPNLCWLEVEGRQTVKTFERPGGGGRTRVIENGKVFEKAELIFRQFISGNYRKPCKRCCRVKLIFCLRT
jgi:hypothetical protein